MKMGRSRAWSRVVFLAVAAALLVSVPGFAQDYVFHRSADPATDPSKRVTSWDFGRVVKEQTSVAELAVSMINYSTAFDDTGNKVKFVLEDAKNLLVFNSQINVEFTGDTVSLDLLIDSAGSFIPFFYSYFPSTGPFSVSFRPNVRGSFRDTLTFKFFYPRVQTIKFPIRGQGIGVLQLLNSSGQPVDSFNLTANPTRVGDSLPGDGQPITVRNISLDQLGRISDVISTDPSIFHIVNRQLEVQPGQTAVLSMQFTPQALALDTAKLKIVSEDFAVDTPFVRGIGRGRLSLDYFTDDDTTDAVGNTVHKTIDTLRLYNANAGVCDTAQDTLIWLQNKLNQNVEIELVMQDGRYTKLLSQFGAARSENDTLYFTTTECSGVAVDSITYRGVKYGRGDTIYVGAVPIPVGTDTVLVDCSPRDGTPETPVYDATIVPIVLTRTLPLNDSLRVWVRFCPKLRAEYQDTILTTYQPFINSTATVTGRFPVSGAAVGPGFAASRDSIDFGPLTPGLSRKDSILASNPGSLAVTLTVDTTGLDPVFRLRTEDVTTFPAGSSTYIVFEYTAIDAALHLDTVYVRSNDPNNPTLRLLLSGGTQAPLVAANPTVLDFGDVVVSDSLTKTVYVANRGLVALNVSNITKTRAQFTVSPTSFALNPGDSQGVSVKFVPTGPSAFDDTLRIVSDDPKTPTLRVPVTAGGSNPNYSGDTLLAFGATTLNSGALVDSLAIRNNGTRGSMICSLKVLTGASFSLATPSDAVKFVGPGQTVRIPIRFQQTDTAVVWDSLRVITNDPAHPAAYVALKGGGFFRQLTWLSGPLTTSPLYDFGKVSVALPETLSSVMSNAGNDTLRVLSISMYNGTQGFKRLTPSTAKILQKERFDVTVEFAPLGPGSFVDTMLIVTNDTTGGNDSIVVALRGTGFEPGLQALVSEFAFDTTTVGVFALDSVGFENAGDLTVSLSTVQLVRGQRFVLSGAPGSVAGGDTGWVLLYFNPLDTIGYSDTLRVITASPRDTILVALSGSGAGPKYADNVDSLSFSPVPPFSSSQRSFTVRNDGNRPLDLVSILTRKANGIFTRFSPDALVLGAGEEATVTIGFTPQASGAFADTLVIVTTDASADTVYVPLFGQTPDQDINFIPGRLAKVDSSLVDIGGVKVGAFKEGTVTIYNVGLAPLHIDKGELVVAGTGFSFVGGTLNDVTIAADTLKSVQVRYTATQKISETNALRIISNDPDQDTTYVLLSAQGVAGQLRRLSVDSTFAFGIVKVGAVDTSRAVSIQNTLGLRFRLSFANFLTLPQSDFSIIGDVKPLGINPVYKPFKPDSLPTLGRDSILYLRLIYAPADTGSDNSTFRVIGTPDNAGDTINIPVTARAAAPRISISPTSYDFGTLSATPTASRTATLTITNSGPDTLRVTSLAAVNAGAATYTAEPPLPWKIAPGASTPGFTIRARATSRKVYYDTLALGNNDPARDPAYFYTRLVGVAPGDVGFVDTVRISEYEFDNGDVIVPVHLVFDTLEAIKRVSIPLKYTSSVYECVGFDFATTLLENKDGLLPTIDTVNNIVVIKANTIFSTPIVADDFIGTVLARMIFRASPGAAGKDSAITFDTLFVPPDIGYVLQDTALQVILPEFVAGRLDIRTGIDDDGLVPTAFELEQNYPNPFNPQTTIAFSIPQAAHVRLVIFNLLGQRIATLVDDILPPGRREVVWRGQDQNGNEVSSGIYFYHLSADDVTETRKMVLMK
jgi:hypothetical protein